MRDGAISYRLQGGGGLTESASKSKNFTVYCFKRCKRIGLGEVNSVLTLGPQCAAFIHAPAFSTLQTIYLLHQFVIKEDVKTSILSFLLLNADDAYFQRDYLSPVE